MLRELEIKDFALIKHLRVPFTSGLNVLTGETGAGKSIIIDALNAVLGGKVGASAIAHGMERAHVEATFEANEELLSWLKDNELADEEFDGLLVSREITKSGTKARINGTLVNVALLQDLRQKLVTIHAQHEARTLQSAQAQLEMLDALADESYKKQLGQVRTLYTKRKELAARIAEINISEEERTRRLEFARFQLGELVDAALTTTDEDETVAAQIKRLANVVQLETALTQVQQLLVDGDGDASPGAIELLQRAVVELTRAGDLDAALAPIGESLNSCIDMIEQEQRSLRKYKDKLDTDPETLSGLEARLAQLATIKRKYGPGLADAISKRESLEQELDNLENSQSKADELNSEHDKVQSELLKTAKGLSDKRTKLAQRLAQTIQSELADLGMPHCKFVISVDATADDVSDCGPSGIDHVEFLIAPNPGQPLAPVSKIASGGELSRVMLAVKTIFAHADSVSTVVFDEIETGLSGKTLKAMRDRLAKLAFSHQILCITHQPLIASVADNHIQVNKQQSAKETSIDASVLDKKERLKAVAAMAAGQDNQAEALKFVETLFAESSQLRASLSDSSR
jgi:DNA repair protein RecN (Recombination protein N)